MLTFKSGEAVAFFKMGELSTIGGILLHADFMRGAAGPHERMMLSLIHI